MKSFYNWVINYSLILLVFVPIIGHGQVLINEISPSNVSGIANFNGDNHDWIEIVNTGGSIDLAGYSLTDDLTSSNTFVFPSDILPAGGKRLIFASDMTHEIVNHYEMAVSGITVWKYVTGSPSLDTNWRNLSYSDYYWNSGLGGVGFGDRDDGTIISPAISVMMRKSFEVEDTSEILNAIFMMDYDDGFVAYLNGIQIARANMGVGAGRPAWNDLATNPHEASLFQGILPDSFYLDSEFLKSILRQGTNVLAVETHDRVTVPTDQTSTPYLFFGMKNNGLVYANPPAWFPQHSVEHYNAKFKLGRYGETIYLLNPAGNIIDQKSFPAISSDHSYGRVPDGSSNWCFISTPSPVLSNNSSICYNGYATVPVFSIAGGFYNSAQTISISSSFPNSEIRYTVNGDIPTTASPVYISSLNILHTTTIRARVFSSGYLPGPVATNTYLINEDVHLPVVSLTTDSLNLWDNNSGIYVLGPNAAAVTPFLGANFWQPWEKPVSVEFYDKSHNQIISFDADFEIYGNYSRAKPQKSFEIKINDKNGIGEINYPFLTDKPYISKFDRIVLRNSGTDWNKVHFRDALMQRLMKNSHVGYVGAEPMSVFLNGEYWGVYMFTEKHNQNWVEANYGYKKDEINLVEEIGSAIITDAGSDESFWSMYNYITSAQPSSSGYYDKVESMLDMKGFTDYFIAETYYNNGDWIGEWTNNIKLWRPEIPGARWKYILIDTDFGFGLKGDLSDNRLSMAINPIAFSHSSEMFDALLRNSLFKRDFINRYCDLLNTIYLPSYVNGLMHQFKDSMEHDMNLHFARWGSDLTEWERNISEMMDFVNQRPSIMREYIRTEFALAGQVTLSVNVFPPGAGRVEISTVVPDSYPWSGVYFNGNPVTVTAIPNPGYSFDHWRSNIIIPANDTNQRTTYNFTSSDQITAFFFGSPAPAQLTISEINYHSDSANNPGDWIELHNYGAISLDISGWSLGDEEDDHRFTFPTGTAIAPGGFLVVTEDSMKFKTVFPTVTNRIGQLHFNYGNQGDVVKIIDYQGAEYLSVYYMDQLPWPLKADGNGYTCELLSVTGNLNDGNNWFEGCYGGSPGTSYTSRMLVDFNIYGNTSFCIGSETLLEISELDNFNYQWKFNDVEIVDADSTTIIATTTGNYSVEMNALGCTGSSSVKNVREVPLSPEPVTFSQYRCQPGTILLHASSKELVTWYDSPGGIFLSAGEYFITPVIFGSETYYITAGRDCPSNPVAVSATIITDNCDGSILVFPNPSSEDIVVLKSQELHPGYAQLLITDIQGSIVTNILMNISTGKIHEVDLSSLNAGMYIFSVYQDEKKYVTKLVRTE